MNWKNNLFSTGPRSGVRLFFNKNKYKREMKRKVPNTFTIFY